MAKATNSLAVDVKVGPIKPGLLPQIVDIHMEAFKEYTNTKLGKGFVQSILDWFTTADDGIVLVAVRPDGQSVGYVAGATSDYHVRMNRALAFPGIAALITHPWIVLRWRFLYSLGRRGWKMVVPARVQAPSHRLASLVTIAVAPNARNLGVGDLLMDAFESECRKRGFKSIRLSVYSSNKPARLLYERRKWEAYGDLNGEQVDYRLLL